MKELNNLELDQESSLWNTLLVEGNSSLFNHSDFVSKSEQSCHEEFQIEEMQDFLSSVQSNQNFLDQMESQSVVDQSEQLFKQKNVNTQDACGLNKVQQQLIQNVEQKVEEKQEVNETIENKQAGLENQNFSSIFKSKTLKGRWKKNTNVPKFLARIYMKYFKEFIDQNDQQCLQYFGKITKKLNQRSSNNFSISDVLSLLRNEGDSHDQTRIRNQKILSQIIQKKLKDEITGNKYIKNHHMSYMVAMKIYGLRCRSKTLVQRVKIF